MFRWFILPAAILAAAVTTTTAAAHGVGLAEPKTAAAVMAKDKAWGDAEERGDVGFVQELLDGDYASVGPSGKITPKAAIVAAAGASPERRQARAEKVAAWRATHPGEPRGQVNIFGDTAILTWLSQDPLSPEPVHSCDIFVYRDGRWRAIYSQHTAAED